MFWPYSAIILMMTAQFNKTDTTAAPGDLLK